MCGIVGFRSNRSEAAPGRQEAVALLMADALRHRGPNAGGVWVEESVSLALAHCRLSILDLSPAGAQPMHSACGRYVIVYNGEIYNHLDLRSELERQGRGTLWNGHSDTETLLAGIAAWGLRATLKRSVGMFALALWDRRERKLTLARDRMGEKPLYYGWSSGAFLFASELAALGRFPGFDNAVDRNVLALYFRYCYVPTPYSILERIYKLEAGCLLTAPLAALSKPLSSPLWPGESTPEGMLVERYWSLEETALQAQSDLIEDEPTAIVALEACLRNAVAGQLISDVPLGAFLSGGIDSSTIVALMQERAAEPVRTYTIGFDEADFNEAAHAAEVARHLGTDHTELYVSPQDALGVIPLLPRLYSEPFADSSQIPTYLVAKLAAAHVTVALSGDGGDELFGGYDRYIWGPRIWNRIGRLPPAARHMISALLRSAPSPIVRHVGARLPLSMRVARLDEKLQKLSERLRMADSLDSFYDNLVSEWPERVQIVVGAGPCPTLRSQSAWVARLPQPEARMMAWDSLTYMSDDILHKVDRAAMGVSLETRVPFLDHRVIELAWRLPVAMKFRDGRGKWPLRQILSRHIPMHMIDRPKGGFALPLGQWLNGPLQEWCEELLSTPSLEEAGYLNVEIIRQKWRAHRSGLMDWAASLWSVLMFQAWLREWRSR